MTNPMNMKFVLLTLGCKQEDISIPLNHHISFFHGKIGSGKSTIARLIDYCLGGSLERNRAIDDELLSVQLSVIIGDNDVLIEREVSSNKIRITWKSPSESGSLLVPAKQVSKTPIWNKHIFGYTDLLFHLFDLKTLKVKLGEGKSSSSRARLSFRDMMPFSYLKQKDMISSFFKLDTIILKAKSRNVMRFIIGDLTEQIAEFEVKIDQMQEQSESNLKQAENLREFLRNFGFTTKIEMQEQITKLEEKRSIIENDLRTIRSEDVDESHLVDTIREKLRKLSIQTDSEKRALTEINDAISRKRHLMNEIISTRILFARGRAARSILTGAKYDNCPVCGLKVRSKDEISNDECILCGRSDSDESIDNVTSDDIQSEFDIRISELRDAIERHEQAYSKQKGIVQSLSAEQKQMEALYNKRFDEYDPKTLASIRHMERELGSIDERILRFHDNSLTIQGIADLEKQAGMLLIEIKKLEKEIEDEKKRNQNIEKYIQDIESEYLEALLSVGFPGLVENDTVKLDRKSWMPNILPRGDESKAWGFSNAGSAGKTVLMKTCFALVLHKVATKYQLNLPNFIIIDAPMDHIGKDVNLEIFKQFYNYLYHTAKDYLQDTQFIIIDHHLVPPILDGIDLFERYMTPDEDENPPLITYYREAQNNNNSKSNEA